MAKKKCAAIVGPTASGKTFLAVETAKKLGAEIICCDSMQIYKEMNIGTAKPTLNEQCGVPHHLFSFVPICQNFSVADYVPLARKKIDEISARGSLPIFCGGTGLYLDSVNYQKDYSPSIDPSIREKLKLKSNDELFDLLAENDPDSAVSIHKNNRKRIIRALEIFFGTGKTKSEWDAKTRSIEPLYDLKTIVLEYKDRELLYQRIDTRVDTMFDSGLIEEAKSLNLNIGTTACEAIGYKELNGYFNGEYSLDTARDMIKKATRHYAKRQMTWFRRNRDAFVIYPDEYTDLNDIVKIILNYLTK